MDEKEKQKEIEIVTGDGSDLDISHVKKHLPIEKPKSSENTKKNIIIPNEKKSDTNNKEDE